jgi:ADP-L-glycero-D-manno-heptose 6-epimerase
VTSRPTYIVTGACGFVGANLTARLQALPAQPHIIAVDNFGSGSFHNLIDAAARHSQHFTGSLIARAHHQCDWAALLHEHHPHAVFHLGAITDTTVADQPTMIHENVEGFRAMMLACAHRQVPLVYASSAATYGTPPHTAQRVPFPESAAGKPSNIYGFSKWLMECEHHRLAHELTANSKPTPHIVGLRFFNVFGPGERSKGKMASMPYQLAKQLLEGKRPRLFAPGDQARDQIYVDDVVSCCLAAAGLASSSSITPGVYNLGSGSATTFNQIADAVREGLGITDRPTEYFDMPPDIRQFYQDYTCADLTSIKKALHWAPKWKPHDAIVAYARYLKANP